MKAVCGRGASFLWRALCQPYRLYRGRLSVQLIASYLAVVFLTMVALYVGVVAAFLGYLPSFVLIGGAEEATLDYSMGEKARTVAAWLGDGPTGQGGGLDDPEAVTDVLRAALDRGAVDHTASPRAGFALDRVDFALEPVMNFATGSVRSTPIHRRSWRRISFRSPSEPRGRRAGPSS
ncbi:MAG: hypothetical protein M3Q10_15720, partial [Chloroflexota bacterium]|nr:hypothetical protein [Chloroflexota bacterium]